MFLYHFPNTFLSKRAVRFREKEHEFDISLPLYRYINVIKSCIWLGFSVNFHTITQTGSLLYMSEAEVHNATQGSARLEFIYGADENGKEEKKA